MGKIIRLPQDLINKIAAGEVVERPASVVKELLENSIDANASEITIFLENGGKKLIRVIDNGEGISSEDLPLVLERHTTSKIKNFEDLLNISSFGFRGEALSSIAAVSKFSIASRQKNSKLGAKLVVLDQDEYEVEPYSGPVGTVVEVKDLFYNVPARLKFLKSAQTEYKHILGTVENIALFATKQRIRLIKQDKEVFDLLPTDKRFVRILQLLGLDKNDIITGEVSDGYFKVEMYLLHPKLLGERSKFLKFFVNGRYIEDKGLVAALNAGISEYVPHNYKASGVIFINMPATYVDVNVHPRKLEVKFANPYRVFSFIKGAVRQLLATKIKKELHVPSSAFSTSSMGYEVPTDFALGETARETVDKIEVEQQNAVKRLRSGEIRLPTSSYQADIFKSSYNIEAAGQDFKVPHEIEDVDVNKPKEELYAHMTSTKELQHIRSVSQLLNRYILVEWEQEIWIIDQHAAAERIRYESLLNRFKGKKTEAQRLLGFPEIRLSAFEEELLREHKDLINKLGFEFRLKNGSVLLEQAPAFLKYADIERVFRDLLDQFKDYDQAEVDLNNVDFITDNKFSLIVATIACHNSIRANEKMDEQEVKRMVEQLLSCRIPYACPHGRRLVWILTAEEIDKQFMRT